MIITLITLITVHVIANIIEKNQTLLCTLIAEAPIIEGQGAVHMPALVRA